MDETPKAHVKRIVATEDLHYYNWYEDRPMRADEVGIVQRDSAWRVYSTDERASAVYDVTHGDEETALGDFLGKLRATNRYFGLRTKR